MIRDGGGRLGGNEYKGGARVGRVHGDDGVRVVLAMGVTTCCSPRAASSTTAAKCRLLAARASGRLRDPAHGPKRLAPEVI